MSGVEEVPAGREHPRGCVPNTPMNADNRGIYTTPTHIMPERVKEVLEYVNKTAIVSGAIDVDGLMKKIFEC